MKQIKQRYTIKAPLIAVWRALIDPTVINEWGGGPAVMSDKLDKFSLWGGDIYGQNIEVEEAKLLVQDWYSDDWKTPSKVTFMIKSEGKNTLLYLIHENFPEANGKDLSAGWKDYYLGPLKQLLESQYKN